MIGKRENVVVYPPLPPPVISSTQVCMLVLPLLKHSMFLGLSFNEGVGLNDAALTF